MTASLLSTSFLLAGSPTVVAFTSQIPRSHLTPRPPTPTAPLPLFATSKKSSSPLPP
eukprot:CAMPEP_0171421932 /NCGR_PEP_ID=MMETSP0881-20121228/911_1 /TAXON_ID=67004 /ORGANISM="Thalassiosira weissflogii, Strain CCMP1336" /LENGTH=56 /DNA_ID=CAMNT_0011940427 /DNA_START=140 /DNA_END=307 /DNA_ORIENTATION=-